MCELGRITHILNKTRRLKLSRLSNNLEIWILIGPNCQK
jgi:hypothetical protein